MALINLYKVTKALTNLLMQSITQDIDSALSGLLTVTAIPPEKVVENPSNTLSLHLYHVAEDPYYKNALGPGSDVPNVAKVPRALSLFYILTAHHETDSNLDVNAETQQKLMGYALKTFHDFPVITDQTKIDGTFILDPDLRGKDNTLQVILRPVSREDALAFWNSEETRTARLSAYYEVRVVMLEPKKRNRPAHRRTPGRATSCRGLPRPSSNPCATARPGDPDPNAPRPLDRSSLSTCLNPKLEGHFPSALRRTYCLSLNIRDSPACRARPREGDSSQL